MNINNTISPTQRLLELAGLDFERIRPLLHDHALVIDLLSALVQDCQSCREILPQEITSLDLISAKKRVHSLKGSAMTMGATALARDLGAFESHLLNDYIDPESYSTLIKTLEQTQIQITAYTVRATQPLATTPNNSAEYQQSILSTTQPLASYVLLLVDDNELIRDALAAILNKAGAIVQLAQSGQEALNLISKNQYHAVLIDLQMPILNGLQTSQLIRTQQKYEGLLIIGIGAGSESHTKEECLAHGMNDFIPKKTQSIDFIATVAKAIRQKFNPNH